ncbi:unnamed protein product [Durusdinium trenchii]|uniref:Uncharacterized protein n=2 Tax=Durusdinium trenchii TaxID=1381693 RepID=A0ABP0IKM8_9DINO
MVPRMAFHAGGMFRGVHARMYIAGCAGSRCTVRRFCGPPPSQSQGVVGPERIFFLPCPRIPSEPAALFHQDLSVMVANLGFLFRCIVASLMTSRRVRCNTRFVAILGDSRRAEGEGAVSPTSPLQLEIVGDEVQMMYAEEVWVAATFRKALQRFSDPVLGSKRAKSARTAGWRFSRHSVADALEDFAYTEPSATLLLNDVAKESAEDALQDLHSKNSSISRLILCSGLEENLPPDLLERLPTRQVKLGGPLSSSQRLVVMNYLIDRTWSCALHRPGREKCVSLP